MAYTSPYTSPCPYRRLINKSAPFPHPLIRSKNRIPARTSRSTAPGCLAGRKPPKFTYRHFSGYYSLTPFSMGSSVYGSSNELF